MAKHQHDDGQGCRRVFIDDVEIRDVIEYDTEAGTLKRYRRNDDGSFMLDLTRTFICTEVLKGVVTVEFDEGPGPTYNTTKKVTHRR